MACKATTKAGKPCQSTSVRENGLCTSHQPKEFKEARGFGGAQPNSGVPKKPRLIDVLKEEVEERMAEVTAPFWDGLKSSDMDLRQRSARELLDRAYGKPRQATEITGADEGPLEIVTLPNSEDWQQQVAKVLQNSGALNDPDQDE